VWLTNPSALTTALSGWWFPVARGAPPSAGYQAQALTVAEHRIALAGYRLATLLNDALK